MKKRIVITSLLLAIALLFSACAGGAAPAANGSQKTETKYLSIGTGSVTGVYYPLGGALSSIVTNKIDGYSCAAESTGGAVENATLLINGQLDLGFVAASTLYDAQHGLNSFEGMDGSKIKAVFSFFPEVVQIISVDPEIKAITDLRGKRVAVGAAGSGTEVMARALLELNDMSYDDIEEDFLGFGDAATGLKDGTVDVAFTWAGIPTASVMELCATHDISLISFDDAELQRLMQVSSYCVPAQITKDTYPRLYADAQSFSIPAIICCNADLSEEFVYDFLTAVFDNLDLLAETHERGGDLSLETVLNGISDADMHPGAVKFFTEKGVMG